MSAVKESNKRNGGRTVLRGYRMTDHTRNKNSLEKKWK
jgi:hypothetical protein